MAKILIVEDDLELSEEVSDWLESDEYIVDRCESGQDALQLLDFNNYSVVVLDLNLPDLDGVSICKEIRKRKSSARVLMLTGRSDLGDKVQGFEAGADDYLTKPFEIVELSLRIKALLNRPDVAPAERLECRHIQLDPKNHKVFRNGEEIDLYPREFALLEFLMRHPGQFFNARELIKSVWPADSGISAENVRVAIFRLRKATANGDEVIIENLRSVGYRVSEDRELTK